MFKEEAKQLKSKLSQLAQEDKENRQPEDFDKISALETHKKGLEKKLQVVEKKLRKYVEHADNLKKEQDGIKNMIKSTLLEADSHEDIGDNISGHVVLLCERLNELEEERVSFIEHQQGAKALQDQLAQAKSTISGFEEVISGKEVKLEELSKEITDMEEKLSEANRAIVANKRKEEEMHKIIEDVKASANELEFEKNRQVNYLTKENLRLHEDLKKEKKQCRVLKTKYKLAKSDNEEHTSDLGSILPSHQLDEQDKENNPNKIPRSSSKPSRTSLSRPNLGLGSGEGEINDENTQECQQS